MGFSDIGLQFDPRIIYPLTAYKFHTLKLRGIFVKVHASAKNNLDFVCRCGGKFLGSRQQLQLCYGCVIPLGAAKLSPSEKHILSFGEREVSGERLRIFFCRGKMGKNHGKGFSL